MAVSVTVTVTVLPTVAPVLPKVASGQACYSGSRINILFPIFSASFGCFGAFALMLGQQNVSLDSHLSVSECLLRFYARKRGVSECLLTGGHPPPGGIGSL